jgi:hypothetical protein
MHYENKYWYQAEGSSRNIEKNTPLEHVTKRTGPEAQQNTPTTPELNLKVGQKGHRKEQTIRASKNSVLDHKKNWPRGTAKHTLHLNEGKNTSKKVRRASNKELPKQILVS